MTTAILEHERKSVTSFYEHERQSLEGPGREAPSGTSVEYGSDDKPDISVSDPKRFNNTPEITGTNPTGDPNSSTAPDTVTIGGVTIQVSSLVLLGLVAFVSIHALRS